MRTRPLLVILVGLPEAGAQVRATWTMQQVNLRFAGDCSLQARIELILPGILPPPAAEAAA